VILADTDSDSIFYEGVEQALNMPNVEVRIFGKPSSRPNRRMGVVLAPTVELAKKAASSIRVMSAS
jgi:phosphoribosylglycinamide formyltransferase 2